MADLPVLNRQYPAAGQYGRTPMRQTGPGTYQVRPRFGWERRPGFGPAAFAGRRPLGNGPYGLPNFFDGNGSKPIGGRIAGPGGFQGSSQPCTPGQVQKMMAQCLTQMFQVINLVVKACICLQAQKQAQQPQGPQEKDPNASLPPANQQDPSAGKPATGPQDPSMGKPATGPQDPSMGKPATGPQDPGMGKPATGPQDPSVDKPATGPQDSSASLPPANQQDPGAAQGAQAGQTSATLTADDLKPLINSINTLADSMKQCNVPSQQPADPQTGAPSTKAPTGEGADGSNYAPSTGGSGGFSPDDLNKMPQK